MKGLSRCKRGDLDALREQLREQEGRIATLQERQESDEGIISTQAE